MPFSYDLILKILGSRFLVRTFKIYCIVYSSNILLYVKYYILTRIYKIWIWTNKWNIYSEMNYSFCFTISLHNLNTLKREY